jgi:hypothetical protein
LGLLLVAMASTILYMFRMAHTSAFFTEHDDHPLSAAGQRRYSIYKSRQNPSPVDTDKKDEAPVDEHYSKYKPKQKKIIHSVAEKEEDESKKAPVDEHYSQYQPKKGSENKKVVHSVSSGQKEVTPKNPRVDERYSQYQPKKESENKRVVQSVFSEHKEVEPVGRTQEENPLVDKHYSKYQPKNIGAQNSEQFRQDRLEDGNPSKPRKNVFKGT